jgi:hypothetical protein
MRTWIRLRWSSQVGLDGGNRAASGAESDSPPQTTTVGLAAIGRKLAPPKCGRSGLGQKIVSIFNGGVQPWHKLKAGAPGILCSNTCSHTNESAEFLNIFLEAFNPLETSLCQPKVEHCSGQKGGQDWLIEGGGQEETKKNNLFFDIIYISGKNNLKKLDSFAKNQPTTS